MKSLFTKKSFDAQKDALEDIFVAFFEILKQTDAKAFANLKEQIRQQYQAQNAPTSLQFQLNTFYKQLFSDYDVDAIEAYLKNFYPHFFGGKKIPPLSKKEAKFAYLCDITDLYDSTFFDQDPELQNLTLDQKIDVLEKEMRLMTKSELREREAQRTLFNDLCKQLKINNNRFALTPDMSLEDKLIILKNDYFMLRNVCPEVVGECIF